MTQTMTNDRRGQRGYSLAEIMVASAIFTIVILAVLLIYDQSNKVFKQSSEASDMQQSTRVAFDKLVGDLRLTGFDFDRDGVPFGALASAWSKSTTYTAGMLVQPNNPNGHTYICITGGVSDTTEPVWPESSDDQVKDNTVIWQEDGTLQYQQPDEQVEYAGISAIAIRANFNYETATGACKDATTPCENGREPKLQTTPFPVVTTANNEIVAYALKPVKWASGETADDLVFYADTAIPREANPSDDGKEAKITITGVDLCANGCKSPPYNLVRYTIQDDGTPDSGTILAENIRSMSFRYFNSTNANALTDVTAIDEIKGNAIPNGDGQYDGSKPNEEIVGRDTRATIRSIELTLAGMNAYPESTYTHPTDTVAPHYRQLELKSLVVPRNIGRRGMKEYNVDPPKAPELVSVCAGACNAVFATWKAPTTGGDIDSYAILYDNDSCNGGFRYSEEAGLNLQGSIGRFIEPGQNYYFAVQAINKWGAETSNCIGPVNVVNRTTPAPLAEFYASGGSDPDYGTVPNQIDLYFPAAAENVGGKDSLSCSGSGNLTQSTMPPSEKRYYEIIRGDTIGFQPGDPGVVTILDAGKLPQPTVSGNYLRYIDTTAANCTTYYYRIRVVDYCARDNAMNSSNDTAEATSDYYPDLGEKAIEGIAKDETNKPKAPTLTLAKDVCDGASGNCDLTFSWSAVTQNVNDEPIAIEQYIFRGYKNDGTGAYVLTVQNTLTDGALTKTVTVKNTEEWKFTVAALGCLESVESNEIIYPCSFNAGNLKLTLDADYGGSGTEADPYIVEGPTITAATDSSVDSISFALFNVATGTQIGSTFTQAGPTTTASYGLTSTDDGTLVRILVTAKDSKGCSKNAELFIRDQAAPACSLTDTGSQSSLVTVGKDFVTFTLKNNATTALTLQKIVAKYTTSGSMKGLTSVSFNGGADVTVNCNSPTAIVTPSGTQTVPASSSSYTVKLNMNVGNLGGSNPITSLCIVYQASTGDIVQCQIHPSSATCTVPSGAPCQ